MMQYLKNSLSAILLIGLFTTSVVPTSVVADNKTTEKDSEDGVTILAGPEDKFVTNENGFEVHANAEGRNIRLIFARKKGHSGISAASGISTKRSECPFRGKPVLLTVRASDHQVELNPAGGTPTECRLVPAKGSSVEGLMDAAIKSQYVDFQIGESLAASESRGWYRVTK
ncbi:MAG: hypothetical protein V7701_12340 [Sneathiella sp.]